MTSRYARPIGVIGERRGSSHSPLSARSPRSRSRSRAVPPTRRSRWSISSAVTCSAAQRAPQSGSRTRRDPDASAPSRSTSRSASVQSAPPGGRDCSTSADSRTRDIVARDISTWRRGNHHVTVPLKTTAQPARSPQSANRRTIQRLDGHRQPFRARPRPDVVATAQAARVDQRQGLPRPRSERRLPQNRGSPTNDVQKPGWRSRLQRQTGATYTNVDLRHVDANGLYDFAGSGREQLPLCVAAPGSATGQRDRVGSAPGRGASRSSAGAARSPLEPRLEGPFGRAADRRRRDQPGLRRRSRHGVRLRGRRHRRVRELHRQRRR